VRQRLAAIFKSRSRDAWQTVFDGTDACVSPVLGIDEVVNHPHNIAANSFSLIDGALHPSPAPRFSRTPPAPPGHAPSAESRTAQLKEWGLTDADIV
jgi:alpha-methylacyl-CoA racemase